MDRVELALALKALSGAVARSEEVTAFASVFFDGGWARSYDDAIAIAVRCEFPVSGGLRAKTLSAWVNACSGEEVEVVETDRTDVRLKCGRSKLVLPLLPRSQFQFERPTAALVEIPAPFNLLDGLDRCSSYMGNDPAHPWRMGVTLDIADGRADMLATNNVGIVRAFVGVDSGVETSVVLPPRFVQMLLDATKRVGLSALCIGEGWAEATLEDETTIFARTFGDVDVESFTRVLAGAKKGVELVDLPEGLLPIAKRASAVMSAVGAVFASITVERSEMTITVGESAGTMIDSISFEGGEKADVKMLLPYILPALEKATQICVGSRAVILAGDGYEAAISILG